MKDLIHIYSMSKNDLKFFMDSEGSLYWRQGKGGIAALYEMPKSLQIPFLVKFIQNHDLAQRTRIIKNPIMGIDLYIKSRFLNNEPLGL